MYIAFIIAFTLTSVLILWHAFHGITNMRDHVPSAVVMTVSSIVLIVLTVISVNKISSAMPGDDMVDTASINAVDMALDTKEPMLKEIAKFILEEGNNVDFVTVDKNRDIYVVNIYTFEGKDKMFILHHWEMYHLLPYLEFDNVPLVE